jgi:hypothetical protein
VQTPAFDAALGHGHVGFRWWKARAMQTTTASATRPPRQGHDKGRPQDGGVLRLERLRDSWGSIADRQPYHQGAGKIVMFRLVSIISSEISAMAFAIYLWFFLFQSPGYMPPPDEVMRDSFSFCGICAGYWWFQSGSLAVSGASSSIRVATDVLASFIPIIVAGYAIIDFWRGVLPLSEFKQIRRLFCSLHSALGCYV